MASKDPHFLFLLAADKPKLTRFVAFLIGCAMTMAFAPMEWGFLATLLVIPLLFLSLTTSPGDAGAHYFWFGLGLFLTGTYWIYISVHVFGNAALWIAILLMVGLSLIMAMILRLAGWLTTRLSHGEPWLLLAVGPAAWVAIEWFRGWILTGFPWMALGYSQVDGILGGWAPVLGIYGVSFMLVLSATAVLVTILVPGRQRLFALGFVLLPWIGGGILGAMEWTEPHGKPIRTTIVQGGVSQDLKWRAEQRPITMDLYRGATLSVPDSDLVVWPEVAIPAVDDQIEGYLGQVAEAATDNEQTVLLGILERSAARSDEPRIYNSVISVDANERQAYRKRHLVPFGEYFPVPAWVREWMKMQNLPHADLAAGRDVQPLLQTVGGTTIAVAICYEDAYGAEQLYAFPEADLIVNVSNDAWFGDSIAPHQHLQIARMRALETGRFAVRATNNGISAFIGPDGSLLEVGRQFAPELMTMDLRAHRGATPYVTMGNWPVIGGSLILLGIFWIRSRAGL